jgi:hypothetical protein
MLVLNGRVRPQPDVHAQTRQKPARARVAPAELTSVCAGTGRGDPNLAFEYWNEYWKVHAPKCSWSELGSASALILRYDRVHRIALGRSSFFPPPYRAIVDEEGRLPADLHFNKMPKTFNLEGPNAS